MIDPESNKGRIGMLIKRTLPDRTEPSKWCGKHPKSRTRLVARRKWVCLDCIKENEADRGPQ